MFDQHNHMRPRKCRKVCLPPDEKVFKPAGVPLRQLEVTRLELDELEALRLADLEHMYHEQAGKQMGLSRATFGRLLQSAREKVAKALIEGHCISIEADAHRPHINIEEVQKQDV